MFLGIGFQRTSVPKLGFLLLEMKNNFKYFTFSHMYTRAQVGSPVYMKIKNIPENFIKDDGNHIRCTIIYQLNVNAVFT